MVDPALLRPNPWNPNFVAPENEAKLGESIRQLGMFKPIIVRQSTEKKSGTKYEILGGEHRWKESKALKMLEIPIFDLGVIDDDLAKKISLADNPRYGSDDTIKLAELLEGIEGGSQLHEILPFSEADVSAIFASVTIALDELELDDGYDTKVSAEPEETKAEKAPKTHTIMRFKVQIADAERITELIAKIKKRQGLTASDDLTNAGDALVHQLFGAVED
jgi:ParB-like chromosome segregation protein Spo0J